MTNTVAIHDRDDVVIATTDLDEGFEITLPSGDIVRVLEPILRGHKIAIHSIPTASNVIKYGYPIGIAITDIEKGQWVHTHNLASGLKGIRKYNYEATEIYSSSPEHTHTFLGYVRTDGQIGVRNEIWVLNTVGCINKTCERIASQAQATYGDRVDGVYHFAHPYGCSQLGDDLDYTQRILTSLALHPNAAGVLIVGLGCENNQISLMKSKLGNYDSNRIRFLEAQGIADEISEGLAIIGELVNLASECRREPVPLARLKIGLKCGGSDGFSGITANPLVGMVSDVMVAQGATTVLTEVPEMFGAETILMNRAESSMVFEKTVDLINNFKDYYIRSGQEVYENPSPGNKKGGITTLEEKSLGCTQKGGRSPVVDVVSYGNRVTKAGLNLLQSPGNDMVSVTALAAAGAQIVLFTTGRGTPYGGPVPTLKIATNSELAQNKQNWIDFDAGMLLHGTSMAEMQISLQEVIVSVASGETVTANERHGYREIAIWKDGVTL